MIDTSIPTSIWIGFASAIFLAILGIAYLITLVFSFIKAGLSFPPPAPVQLAGAIISIFTSLSLIFLMTALRWQVAEGRQLFVELSIIFMALLCVMTSANRFVQLSVAPKYLHSDHPEVGQLIHPYGPQSIMFAFESLGWGVFYGLGSLCAALAFGGNGLEQWISWLFLIGGLLSLLFTIGFLTRQLILSVLGFPAWSFFLPVTSALLAVWFWNMR